MPCDGIAVATAKVSIEVAKYLDMMDKTAIDKVIETYLGNLNFSKNERQFTVFFSYGRIRIVGNSPLGLDEKLEKLLTNLAGKIRQQVIIQKLAQAGVKINQNQIANNGMRVLEVEL